MASAYPSNTLVSSEDVRGTDVYGPTRNKVGDIDHLMIDKMSGKVVYAVMGFGGFLGMGQSQYPVPWSALRYDTSLGGFVTGITQEQLQNAPAFAEDSWGNREWEQKVHQHYNAAPYWSASSSTLY